ncbi:MAG: hypothetical protein QRY72_03630 [Candidatus Rhabdochlamydia sp.]
MNTLSSHICFALKSYKQLSKISFIFCFLMTLLASCSQDKPKDDIHFGPTPCDQTHQQTASD